MSCCGTQNLLCSALCVQSVVLCNDGVYNQLCCGGLQDYSDSPSPILDWDFLDLQTGSGTWEQDFGLSIIFLHLDIEGPISALLSLLASRLSRLAARATLPLSTLCRRSSSSHLPAECYHTGLSSSLPAEYYDAGLQYYLQLKSVSPSPTPLSMLPFLQELISSHQTLSSLCLSARLCPASSVSGEVTRRFTLRRLRRPSRPA